MAGLIFYIRSGLCCETKPVTGCFALHKALPGFFLCIFSSLTCLKKPVFSLSLFLKSEKIPALLSLGKGLEYRPSRDLQSVPSAYGLSTGLGHGSEIIEGSIFRAFGTEVCLSRYQFQRSICFLEMHTTFKHSLVIEQHCFLGGYGKKREECAVDFRERSARCGKMHFT